jgi:hypothetical protein
MVLSRLQKKCLKHDIDTDEDDMAITHHDDLQLIKDVVRLSQNVGLIHVFQLVTYVPRRP